MIVPYIHDTEQKSRDRSTCMDHQLIFEKVPRQFNGERMIFSTNGIQTTGHPHAKKRKNLDTDLNISHKN